MWWLLHCVGGCLIEVAVGVVVLHDVGVFC